VVQVEWADPAFEDLRCIHDYISRDSMKYAQIIVEKIVSVAGRLSAFPESGSTLPELPDSEYRQVLVGSYRVIYRFEVTDNRVLVVAIVHGSRDLKSAAEDRLVPKGKGK